jgi:hypothetical protein
MGERQLDARLRAPDSLVTSGLRRTLFSAMDVFGGAVTEPRFSSAGCRRFETNVRANMGTTLPERMFWLAGLWLFVTGAIWKTGERTEKVVSPAIRKATSDWLLQNRPSRVTSLFATVFGGAFEAVFGPRQFSVRCLAACVLLDSIGVVARMATLKIVYGYPVIPKTWFDAKTIYSLIVEVIILFLLIWKTRLLLDFSKRRPLLSHGLVLATFDALVAANFYLVTLYFYVASFDPFLRNPLHFVVAFLRLMLLPNIDAVGSHLRAIMHVILGQTMVFSSLWILAFYFARILIRVSLPLNRLWTFFLKRSDVSDHPFLVVSFAIILMTTVGFLATGLYLAL